MAARDDINRCWYYDRGVNESWRKQIKPIPKPNWRPDSWYWEIDGEVGFTRPSHIIRVKRGTSKTTQTDDASR